MVHEKSSDTYLMNRDIFQLDGTETQHSNIPLFPPGRRPYGPEANCERSELSSVFASKARTLIVVSGGHSLGRTILYYHRQN